MSAGGEVGEEKRISNRPHTEHGAPHGAQSHGPEIMGMI